MLSLAWPVILMGRGAKWKKNCDVIFGDVFRWHKYDYVTEMTFLKLNSVTIGLKKHKLAKSRNFCMVEGWRAPSA